MRRGEWPVAWWANVRSRSARRRGGRFDAPPIRGLEYCGEYEYGCGGLRWAGRNGGERERDWECDVSLGPSVLPDGESAAAAGTVMGKWCIVAGGVGAVMVVFECEC